jgi:hypothetical protein
MIVETMKAKVFRALNTLARAFIQVVIMFHIKARTQLESYTCFLFSNIIACNSDIAIQGLRTRAINSWKIMDLESYN